MSFSESAGRLRLSTSFTEIFDKKAYDELTSGIETKVEGTTGIVELVFSNGSSLTLSYRLV